MGKSLVEQNEERKQRLQKLKEMTNEKKRPREEQVELTFKSYTPENQELQTYVKEAPKFGPESKNVVDTVETRAEKMKEQIMEEESKRNPELDLNNLAPKKPNWDLKRDLEKRLERLDKMTMIAVSDLIRERLKKEGNIALAVGHDQVIDDE
ncbi:Coiled-coil domain-containing protein 12 [Boothiomyces sp. JEL0838]|nr:Coiled-coil domain-containing protein 12 [Boothiomyces sp. JEL0838]